MRPFRFSVLLGIAPELARGTGMAHGIIDLVTTTVFRVEQMDCDAEEQLVRLRLGQLDEAKDVRVDLDNRIVAVTHSADPSSVRVALDELNLDTTKVGDPNVSGLVSQSMGLVADSIDMLADASVYALSLIAVGRARLHKMRLVAGSGYLQLGLAVLGLVEVVRRFVTHHFRHSTLQQLHPTSRLLSERWIGQHHVVAVTWIGTK